MCSVAVWPSPRVCTLVLSLYMYFFYVTAHKHLLDILLHVHVYGKWTYLHVYTCTCTSEECCREITDYSYTVDSSQVTHTRTHTRTNSQTHSSSWGVWSLVREEHFYTLDTSGSGQSLLIYIENCVYVYTCTCTCTQVTQATIYDSKWSLSLNLNSPEAMATACAVHLIE